MTLFYRICRKMQNPLVREIKKNRPNANNRFAICTIRPVFPRFDCRFPPRGRINTMDVRFDFSIPVEVPDEHHIDDSMANSQFGGLYHQSGTRRGRRHDGVVSAIDHGRRLAKRDL